MLQIYEFTVLKIRTVANLIQFFFFFHIEKTYEQI